MLFMDVLSSTSEHGIGPFNDTMFGLSTGYRYAGHSTSYVNWDAFFTPLDRSLNRVSSSAAVGSTAQGLLSPAKTAEYAGLN